MDCKCTSFVFVIFLVLPGLHGQDFGYEGAEGPSNWANKFSQCKGKHQSPIDIDYHQVKEVQLPKLKFNHFNKNINNVQLNNNGHTVKLTINDDTVPTINGGPLNATYAFDHLHFHWGPNDTLGSENKVNNASFPLELHMLFYNMYYGTVQEASRYPDGFCVLSFLYLAGDVPNKHYDAFERGLQKIVAVNSTKTVSNFGSLDKFTMSDKQKYFTYEGSLTTPPCSEVVTWIEFRDFVPISHQQMMAFRNLDGAQGVKLSHNYRPTQNINDRVIRYNSASKVTTSTIVVGLIGIIGTFN